MSQAAPPAALDAVAPPAAPPAPTPVPVPESAPAPATTAGAQRAFSTSILVSAVRCVLTYVVFPYVAPALGHATGVGPVAGLAIGLVAIASNVVSIRRFHRAHHRRRWLFTAISCSVIGLLLVLLVEDILHLAG